MAEISKQTMRDRAAKVLSLMAFILAAGLFGGAGFAATSEDPQHAYLRGIAHQRAVAREEMRKHLQLDEKEWAQRDAEWAARCDARADDVRQIWEGSWRRCMDAHVISADVARGAHGR